MSKKLKTYDITRKNRRIYTKTEFEVDNRETFDEFKADFARANFARRKKTKTEIGTTNAWVKQGILLGFKMGNMVNMSFSGEIFQFFDKDTYPLRPMNLDEKIRIVPGGTTIRDGCFIAENVVLMPPSYVNVGAYVDEGTMIDSHALVGSCAQIGKRVHISAAAQIGGVLEPINANPVIIEDDVLVGGNTGVYEGVIVRERVVLASGVILTRSTPVFDLVKGEILKSTPEKNARNSRRSSCRARLAPNHKRFRQRKRLVALCADYRQIPRRKNRCFDALEDYLR